MDAGLPQQWDALCLVVALLGMRHGLDPDHLAAIDGLTRYRARVDAAGARHCGAWFSLGHGLVVIITALAASTVAAQWSVPAWMDAFGAWVSIVVLLVLGAVNLRAVLLTPKGQAVTPVGIKGRVFGTLFRRAATASTAGGVALVGALFALSFDTLSQALLFTVAATRFGGWQQALGVGALFTAGMLLTDGLNGYWIARLLRQTDRLAAIASRAMGLVVAVLSLAVGGMGLAHLCLPEQTAWIDGRETLLGLSALVLVILGYALARLLAASARPTLPVLSE